MGDTVSLRQHRQLQRLRKTLIVRAEADVSQQATAIEKTGPDFKPLKDVQAIMDVLPHRCVFLPCKRTDSKDTGVCIAKYSPNTLTLKAFCSFPFLLVDRGIEMEHEKYAVGYKNVTINDNFFPGHFPQRAIMPGKLHFGRPCQAAMQAV